MIGKTLKELRKEMNLTQLQLAEKLTITRSALSLYELDIRDPDTETIIRLCNFFNVSADYILNRTDNRNMSTISINADGLTDDDIEYVNKLIEEIKAQRNKS